MSENGQYVLQGKMYELTNKGPVDEASKFLADKVNALKNEMIVYPAKMKTCCDSIHGYHLPLLSFTPSTNKKSIMI